MQGKLWACTINYTGQRFVFRSEIDQREGHPLGLAPYKMETRYTPGDGPFDETDCFTICELVVRHAQRLRTDLLGGWCQPELPF